MKRIKKLKTGLAFSLMMMFAFPVIAQKYGHINTQELLNLMPEKAAAEQKLKNKAEEFDRTLKELQTNYQTLATNYLKAIENGALSQTDKTAKEKEIGNLENRIRQFDQHASQEIQKLKNELLTPIITKIRTAINEVGQENGYTYVFDSSVGSIVYISPSSNDLMNQVRTKLGL